MLKLQYPVINRSTAYIIPWFLMSWRWKEPWHQEPWNWMYGSLNSARKGINQLCNLSLEKWNNWNYFLFLKIYLAAQEVTLEEPRWCHAVSLNNTHKIFWASENVVQNHLRSVFTMVPSGHRQTLSVFCHMSAILIRSRCVDFNMTLLNYMLYNQWPNWNNLMRVLHKRLLIQKFDLTYPIPCNVQ